MLELKKNAQIQKKYFRDRAFVGVLFVLFCFFILITRLWYLQVNRYEGLSAKAEQNRIAVNPILPKRGEILDRNGFVLASNRLAYTIELVISEIEEIDNLLNKLSIGIKFNEKEKFIIKKKISESNKYARLTIKNNLTEIEVAWLASRSFQFPGVKIKTRWVREYPYGALAAHVIGHIGKISDTDIDVLESLGVLGDYRGTEFIGKRGIEKTYEDVLHGSTGIEEIEVTSKGRPVRLLNRINPISGSDIVLSIDIELQKIAEKALEKYRGALVAIDNESGEILALVSMPSFDPNLFVDGIDIENWKLLSKSPNNPLINRPIYGTYPIGSVYKPFVALAALELGKRGAHDLVADPGYFEFCGQKFRNAKNISHGPADMHRAIVISSDIYFYSLGPEIGVNALHDFSKKFGFGQITGIDLDGERAGILPSTEWKRKAYKNKNQQRWYTGETISVMVGQGYNSFTLLQLAQATATLANGGNYIKPRVANFIRDHVGRVIKLNNKDILYKIPLNIDNINIIKNAMKEVTTSGTAKRAFIGANYSTAGKTGTAQVYSLKGKNYSSNEIDERMRDHSLFIGFAPAENPKITVAVIAENAGWGSAVAAPIARKVFDYWLSSKNQISKN
ncbi:Peptidoglycan D,D-transpeptidase MrdA [Candidatus Kinetoplastibacterium sorsogonicusi]|uniref:Peptidoglycan D,D-transpeptidase MrdA n=1 Tax=Candidatus Kinetoplastidibacterium kentomonadis TaxID=1576550 RepID=A0A3S7JAP7_9PROT|nr:penicillin-binding protein 2 [Candidatus Kinetoplastibacterium sorsogonicusi]AWD32734.1 Peptidoglycan D,D-transpeptidase MrdA [Candidatus Kinetoplastibacterium sorsogonicusi]